MASSVKNTCTKLLQSGNWFSSYSRNVEDVFWDTLYCTYCTNAKSSTKNDV